MNTGLLDCKKNKISVREYGKAIVIDDNLETFIFYVISTFINLNYNFLTYGQSHVEISTVTAYSRKNKQTSKQEKKTEIKTHSSKLYYTHKIMH